MAISRAQTLAGLQIKGFSPAVVRSSEMIELFYRHLHAGTLDAYVRSVPPWWQPVLQPDTPQGWAALFRRHAAFRRWETDHPPAHGPGPAAPPRTCTISSRHRPPCSHGPHRYGLLVLTRLDL